MKTPTISRPHPSRNGHDPEKVARLLLAVAKDPELNQKALIERFRMGGSTITRKLNQAGWHWTGNTDGRWVKR